MTTDNRNKLRTRKLPALFLAEIKCMNGEIKSSGVVSGNVVSVKCAASSYIIADSRPTASNTTINKSCLTDVTHQLGACATF